MANQTPPSRPPARKQSVPKQKPKQAEPEAPPPEPSAQSQQTEETKYDWRQETAKAGFVSMIGLAPAWLISLLFHAAAVPILAVVTISSTSETEELLIASAPMEAREELEEVSELEIEPLEELEVSEETLFQTPQIDPGAIDFGEMAAPVDVLDTNVSDLLVNDSAVTEIGSLFGTEGKGMSSVGEGLKSAATFFGTKSEGRRFCFLVDNSNSMGGGRLETALLELGKAVTRLQKDQYFYIIFYSDTAYPLFHPEQVRDMVPATDENKRRVAQWLPQIEMCLRTAGEEAVAMALSLRPDVVYILGDGAFTDKTAEKLIGNPVQGVVIHTLGMQVEPNVVADFSGIAKRHRGTYRDVGVSPQGFALSKQYPRPKHRTRQSIWGLKLPDK